MVKMNILRGWIVLLLAASSLPTTVAQHAAPHRKAPGRPARPNYKVRGQLTDFWASWCGPCRQENASLVRLYRQYQAKGFEVYGVSVDSRKDAWTAAIQQDGLPWPQVWDVPSETSMASTVYNIYEYPTSFLLDPQGRIIAKNLRGEALAQKLAELLP